MAKSNSELVAARAQAARDACFYLESVSDLQQEFNKRDAIIKQIERVVFLELDPEIPPAYQKTSIKVKTPDPLDIVNSITAALSINAPLVGFRKTGFGDQAEIDAQKRRDFFYASWLKQEEDAGLEIFRRFVWNVVTKGEGIIKTMERQKTAWAVYNARMKKLRAQLDDPKGEYADLDPMAKDLVFDKTTELYKREAAYPITSIDVPPETFYYVKGENGFTRCVEVKMLPYYDGLDRFGVTLDKKGGVVPQQFGLPQYEWKSAMSGQTQLKLVEIWDWEKVRYVLQGPGNEGFKGGKPGTVNGMVVQEFKHGYGDKNLRTLDKGPYFHSFGLTTASRELHKQGLSVLFGYLDLFPLLNSYLTIQSNAGYMTGFPTFKRKTPKGGLLAEQTGAETDMDGVDAMEQAASEEDEELVIGSIYPFDIEPVNQPRSGVDLEKAIQQVRGMIGKALPDIATGGLKSDETGYAVNQALHQAKLRWDPIVSNIQKAMGRRTGFESWLIENKIKETVYVPGTTPADTLTAGTKGRKKDEGWIGIGPDDLHGVHNYQVEMRPENPTNELLDIRKHGQLVEGGFESVFQATEELGRNPVEVEKQRLLAELKQQPEVRTLLMQSTFQQLAISDKSKMSEAGADQAPLPNSQGQPSPTAPGAQVPATAEKPWALGPGQMPQPGTPTQMPHMNQPPGPTPGSPAGVRGLPATHQPGLGGG